MYPASREEWRRLFSRDALPRGATFSVLKVGARALAHFDEEGAEVGVRVCSHKLAKYETGHQYTNAPGQIQKPTVSLAISAALSIWHRAAAPFGLFQTVI